MYIHAIQFVSKDVNGGIQELLFGTLTHEEGHLDRLESQLDQIEHVGIGKYCLSKPIRASYKAGRTGNFD